MNLTMDIVIKKSKNVVFRKIEAGQQLERMLFITGTMQMLKLKWTNLRVFPEFMYGH